jgi:hypothetical protein
VVASARSQGDQNERGVKIIIKGTKKEMKETCFWFFKMKEGSKYEEIILGGTKKLL